MKKRYLTLLLVQTIIGCRAILRDEVGKDLPTNYNNEDILSRKRRPFGGGGGGSGCNFNGIRGGRPGKQRADATGRTFFDLQFLNVGYHENYNINCGGAGGHPVTSYPLFGGHKPTGGGAIGTGEHTQTQGGIHSNKPSKPILSMLLANRPLQGLFSQSQSQTQTQTGILGDTISGFVSLLPKPQDIGQGLGDGISSFIQTLPQIGQSFQSLLPSFDNFQLPSLPPLSSFTQAGSQSMAGSVGQVAPVRPGTPPLTNVVTPAPPDPVTEPTVDSNEIIYNDDVKPVHEDPDFVPGGSNSNKLPPGAYYNRNYVQNRYQSYRNYQNQKANQQFNRNRYHYQQNENPYLQREPRFRQDSNIFSESEESFRGGERTGSRSFRFPT